MFNIFDETHNFGDYYTRKTIPNFEYLHSLKDRTLAV